MVVRPCVPAAPRPGGRPETSLRAATLPPSQKQGPVCLWPPGVYDQVSAVWFEFFDFLSPLNARREAGPLDGNLVCKETRVTLLTCYRSRTPGSLRSWGAFCMCSGSRRLAFPLGAALSSVAGPWTGAGVAGALGEQRQPCGRSRLAGNVGSSRRALSGLQRVFKCVCWKGQQVYISYLKNNNNTVLFIY